MSNKHDHDIANALFAELAENDPLNDQTNPAPAKPTSSSGTRLPNNQPPDDQDSRGASALSSKTAHDQDFLLPKPLPPSDAFLPRRPDTSGASALSTKTSPVQDFSDHNQSAHIEAGHAGADNRRPYLQPGRIGKHRIQRWIGPMTKRQIKLICINHDITEQEFFGMAINMAFAHFGVPRIAFETDRPIEDSKQGGQT